MNLVPLRPSNDVVATLRRIADQIEAGEFAQAQHATLVYGSEIFHMGTPNDQQAATNTLWDLEVARTKLMTRALGL